MNELRGAAIFSPISGSRELKKPGASFIKCIEKVLYFVLIFTHIPTYKYKLVDHTLCMKLCLCTHYAHICAYALLINEGPGSCLMQFTSKQLSML